jgi:hypothetical protein
VTAKSCTRRRAMPVARKRGVGETAVSQKIKNGRLNLQGRSFREEHHVIETASLAKSEFVATRLGLAD